MAGRKPGHGTDDTADSHGRLGIDCAVTNREITKRDGTGRVRRLPAARRWHRPGGGDGGAGPLAGGTDRHAANRVAPLYGSHDGTP